MRRILRASGSGRGRGTRERKRFRNRLSPGRCEPLEPRLLLAGDLVAQWRAQDLNLESGTTVDTWPDTVGQVEANRASGTPELITNQMGGRSLVRFDGSDGERLVVGRQASPISGAGDFSIVIAFSSASNEFVGGNDEWFTNTGLVDAGNLGITQDWGVSMNAAGSVAFGLGAGFLQPPSTVYSAATGLNDGQLHVVSATRAGSEITVYVDHDAPNSRQDADPDARASLEFSIGGLLSGKGSLTGDIAEVRVYDGQLASAEVQTIHDQIVEYYSNQAPVASDDSYTASEDVPLTVSADQGLLQNDTDSDGDPLTVVEDVGPANGQLSLSPDGSFTYTPNANFFGTDAFAYRPFDFRPSDAPATVTIEVTAVHDPASVRNDVYKAVPATPLSVPASEGVLVNDFSIENVTLSAVVEGDVSNGELTLNSDGSFLYDAQGFAGTAIFSYRVNDGVSVSNPATVLIISNTPPVAMPDEYQVLEDQALVVEAALGVLANDVDPDADRLTASVTASPMHGTLTLNNDGSFRYEAAADYFGPDFFGYRIDDRTDESNEAFVQIDVQAVNDPPLSSPDAYFVSPDETMQVDANRGVLANDIDIDSPAISAMLVNDPQNGQLEFQDDGSFTYTPRAGFDGPDQFTYRASDGTDQTDETVVSLRVTRQPLVISEIMASNATTLETMLRATTDGEFEGEVLTPDWIELRNVLSEPLDIGGLHLTDDARLPTKWQIPAGFVIPANGYAVIFASGEDIRDPALDQNGSPHANFQLATGGDYLALNDAQGRVIHEYADEYPGQRTHVSYGLVGEDVGEFAYFMAPTPGAANGTPFSGLVEDTRFTVDRGFYSEPFQVEITTLTEGAVIRYTVDGTRPTAENGEDYTGPLTISQTTTLRAAAFKPGLVPANSDTQSYFFLDDIIEQDQQITLDAGFPNRWRSTPPDYGFDDESQFPRIAGDTNMSVDEAKQLIKQSLTSIPSMSLVMDIDDMFGSDGIYSNPERTGVAWERPTSVELIHPDGRDGFQIDSGIRIQGGAFRGFGLTKKKSLRLLFKTEYGPSKLQYPLFGSDAADQFDTLTLRMEANDGWQWNGAAGQPQYARDEFLRRVQLAMGQPASHGTSIHLYINGMYWGLYNIVERPDQGFGESYFGADAYNWDGINSGTPINSSDDRFRRSRTQAAWREMQNLTRDIDQADTQAEKNDLLMALQGLNPDGTDNPDLEDWLDLENMIDYLIVNYYGHNSDWPFKNYYVGRENSPDSTGFKFFMWDAEWSLFLRSSVTGDNVDARSGVAVPFQNLRSSDEFRVLFGDRVQKHFFNGGVFYVDPENPDWDPEHPERNLPAARYVEWTDQIHDALLAESARWGDQHRPTPYTRDVDWQREFNRIMSSWFPRRSEFMVDRYRAKGLFPSLETAAFNQRGGAISSQFDIELSAPQGTIYYTTDGSDPRMAGGSINPNAIEYTAAFQLPQSAAVKVRVMEGDEWSAIDEASFVVDLLAADASNLRVSELHYHPVDPTDAELLAGHTDADDFEFIELVNIADRSVDLVTIQLKQVIVNGEDQGVGFDFADSDIQELAAGQRVLVVEDLQAFRARYGDDLPVAGQWSGGLSNRSELLTLASGENILHQFTYSDEWYPQTDGLGPSLEIIDPTRADLEAWNQRSAWRFSADIGGSPGIEGEEPVLPGDSNHDGRFDASDLVLVSQIGEYEDGIPENSTFEEGDWNGDLDFDSADMVFAFRLGRYTGAAPAAVASRGVAAALAESSPQPRSKETNRRLPPDSTDVLSVAAPLVDDVELLDELFADEKQFELDDRDELGVNDVEDDFWAHTI